MKFSCECGCTRKSRIVCLWFTFFGIALTLVILGGLCITRHIDVEDACANVNQEKCQQCESIVPEPQQCSDWCGNQCRAEKTVYAFCGEPNIIIGWIMALIVGCLGLFVLLMIPILMEQMC